MLGSNLNYFTAIAVNFEELLLYSAYDERGSDGIFKAYLLLGKITLI